MCPPFLGSEGYWEKATCSIKSGQPLSKKGDFELAVELACRLGWAAFVHRTHVHTVVSGVPLNLGRPKPANEAD
jgi:hypothetical protein